MKVRLSTTRQADDQAIAAHDWWRTHRFAAPDLFRRELAAAFDLLANAPDVGKRYKHRGVPGLRRLLLPNTRSPNSMVAKDATQNTRAYAMPPNNQNLFSGSRKAHPKKGIAA